MLFALIKLQFTVVHVKILTHANRFKSWKGRNQTFKSQGRGQLQGLLNALALSDVLSHGVPLHWCTFFRSILYHCIGFAKAGFTMEYTGAYIANCEEVTEVSQVVQTGTDAHGEQRDLLTPGRAGFGSEGAVGVTGILGLFSDTQGM